MEPSQSTGWGRPNTGTAQAGYTLCWSDSPSITSDFMFTLGDFTVTGPNVQDVACTFGLSCVVSIIGLDLCQHQQDYSAVCRKLW